jgi:rubrerythrin
MDFTDPFTGTERKRLTAAELAQAIRIDMAAELDAINLYQAHLESTDNPVAQAIIGHILAEEKDHLQEFAQLLYVLDPQQAEAVEHARAELAETTGAPLDAAPPSMSASSPGGFTVGSLKDG